MAESEFKNSLKVQGNNIHIKTAELINSELDAYRDYIAEILPGFLDFMEQINTAITALEDNLVMSNVMLKARIKDAVSSVRNTEDKILDDILGFELITPNETDKELLMLLIHKIFDEEVCFRTKDHDKSNGYKAHHCVGTPKKQIEEDFDNISEYILKAKGKREKQEYKNLSNAGKMGIPKEELYQEYYLYPTLREQILQEGYIDEDTINTLKKIIKDMAMHYQENPSIQAILPVFEVQFKTSEVAEEAIYGKAKHDAYKPINEEEIKSQYLNKRLIKGMNFPFKFYRRDGKMMLQHSSLTLVEMWPFLKSAIIKFKREHPGETPTYNANIEMIFPELKPYVNQITKTEPNVLGTDKSVEEIWEAFKTMVIRQDFNMPNYGKKPEGRGEI